MCIKCVLNSLYQNLSLGLFIPTLDSSFALTTNGIPPPLSFLFSLPGEFDPFLFCKGWLTCLPALSLAGLVLGSFMSVTLWKNATKEGSSLGDPVK